MPDELKKLQDRAAEAKSEVSSAAAAIAKFRKANTEEGEMVLDAEGQREMSRLEARVTDARSAQAVADHEVKRENEVIKHQDANRQFQQDASEAAAEIASTNGIENSDDYRARIKDAATKHEGQLTVQTVRRIAAEVAAEIKKKAEAPPPADKPKAKEDKPDKPAPAEAKDKPDDLPTPAEKRQNNVGDPPSGDPNEDAEPGLPGNHKLESLAVPFAGDRFTPAELQSMDRFLETQTPEKIKAA